MPDTLSTENPLAIIGNEDVILGFKALGFNTYSPGGAEDLKIILANLVKENCGVCLIQDDYYKTAQEDIDYFRSLLLPVFIPFSRDGGMAGLKRRVKDIRLRATGKL